MFAQGASGTPTYKLSFPAPPYHFEMGPIRPPSEGQDCSLLIRVNRNCPWNRCLFCNTYKGTSFDYRSVEEVKDDLAVAKAIADGLKRASWTLGFGGRITQEVLTAVVRGTPEAYGRGAAPDDELIARLQCLSLVASWLASGAKTVFLQDANALIMRVPELLQVLAALRESFPSVVRITSYARSKTITQRTPEELAELRAAGLNRLHVGLESGCDEVLAFMDKGVTGEQHVIAGRHVKEAGIQLSEYVMPGLGGRRWSRQHALDSARVLNAVDPDFIRLRSLIVRADSGLAHRAATAEFEELSEDEVVDEIGLFVEQLDCHALLASDQMSNLLMEVEGQLPEDKPKILTRIARYKAMSAFDRLSLRLRRRLRSYLAVRGGLEPAVDAQVEAATRAIEAEAPDAAAQVDRAIAMLKQRFV